MISSVSRFRGKADLGRNDNDLESRVELFKKRLFQLNYIRTRPARWVWSKGYEEMTKSLLSN